MPDLPTFPTDDATLSLVEAALNGSGTRSSLGELLDILSGYNRSRSRPLLDDDGYQVPNVTTYPDPIYHPHDVIRALVAEVRNLRGDPRSEQ